MTKNKDTELKLLSSQCLKIQSSHKIEHKLDITIIPPKHSKCYCHLHSVTRVSARLCQCLFMLLILRNKVIQYMNLIV